MTRKPPITNVVKKIKSKVKPRKKMKSPDIMEKVMDTNASFRFKKATLELIGERIVEIRKMRKMRQNVLARKLDISEAHLRNMEKGVISPRLPILIKIINEFDINPNYLFLETEVKKTRYMVSE